MPLRWNDVIKKCENGELANVEMLNMLTVHILDGNPNDESLIMDAIANSPVAAISEELQELADWIQRAKSEQSRRRSRQRPD